MSETAQTPSAEAPQDKAPPRSPLWPLLLTVQLVCLLLLAVGGFFGWQLWQQRSQADLQGAQQQARLEQLAQQLQGSERAMQALQSRLATLPDAQGLAQQQHLLEQLTQAQGEMERRWQDGAQQLAGELDELRGSQDLRDWQLHEAFYQMRLAALRLEVMKDWDSARLLLQNADELLGQQDDPASFATRKLLAEDLQQLLRLSKLDRSALYLKLAALHTQAAQLSRPLPEFSGAQATAQADAQASWWQRWREDMARYVRIDFEASAQDIRPLLAGQSLNQARLALTLALEQAQWGLLHGEQAVYQSALEQAAQVLTLAFNTEDAATSQLQKNVSELQTLQVAPKLPDLAPLLVSMRHYVRQNTEASRSGYADDEEDEGDEADGEDAQGPEEEQSQGNP